MNKMDAWWRWRGQQRLIRLLRQDGQNYAIKERLPVYTLYLLVTLYGY
jgi:hypothetical protein